MDNNKLLQDILTELKQLRNDINRPPRNRSTSTTNHISRTRQPLTTSNNIGPTQNKPTNKPQTTIGPARSLLNDIYNRPTPLEHCWYHKRHGIAANMNNCPGIEHCSFNLQEEIAKMQATIKRITTTSTKAQKRLETARSTPKPTTSVNIAATIQTSKENAPPAENPTTQDWVTQIEMEIDATKPETLEIPLANLSEDSE